MANYALEWHNKLLSFGLSDGRWKERLCQPMTVMWCAQHSKNHLANRFFRHSHRLNNNHTISQCSIIEDEVVWPYHIWVMLNTCACLSHRYDLITFHRRRRRALCAVSILLFPHIFAFICIIFPIRMFLLKKRKIWICSVAWRSAVLQFALSMTQNCAVLVVGSFIVVKWVAKKPFNLNRRSNAQVQCNQLNWI